ncbi:hypothetical protein NB703_000766 [Pantoea ananatis]|uniref:Uncharacterized protein n=1 Tax=Pantoea ananas TaxID=553 RepID=A0AAJ1FV98_PANAN|nr:hypothetical protein [Pantoea ananatis]MCW0351615.1 hypothetical protein [Pantoea ananatis]
MNPDKINILIKMDNLFSLSVAIKKTKKAMFFYFHNLYLSRHSQLHVFPLFKR